MAQFSPKELEEFEFRQRAEQELAAQNRPSTEMPEADGTSEAIRSLGMGGAGAVLGAASKKLPGLFSPTKPTAAPASSVIVSGAPTTAPGASAVDAARSGLSNEISQQVRTAQRAQRTKEATKTLESLQRQGVKVDPRYLATLPEQYARPSGILIDAEKALLLEAEENARKVAQAKAAPVTQKVAKAVTPVAKQALSAPLSGLGRGVAGLGIGLQAADVINRYKRDDMPGAVISGIGAIGTGLAAFPHPVTRVGGTALSIGAEGLNAYLDYLKNKNRPQTPAAAPEPMPPVPMAKGGKIDKPLSKAERAAKQLNDMKKAAGGHIAMKEGGHTTPAWQRAEGKSPSGGLNALGRASYKRETGGTLKAPQPEGGSRKKSFCARMGGMKKKLTSSKTANDPDSRINKALRKWKC